MNIKRKTGQVWTLDFIVGLMLFLFVVFISVRMLIDLYPTTNDEQIYRDGVYLSDSLLSEGYPENWNTTNVILPGIADNNRINTTQLAVFDEIDYEHLKTLLHITSDFIFYIHNSTSIINLTQCTHGYNLSTDENCTPILTNINYDTLIKLDRIIIYDSNVMTMTLYIWD